MQRVRWNAERVARALSGIAALMAVAMSTFVVLASVMRYLVGAPFAFTEELVGLLFVGVAFVALPACTLRNSHLAVGIVPNMFTGRARKAINCIAYLISISFYVWFGVLAYENMQTTYSIGAHTPVGRFTLWPWTALLPIACGLCALAALIRMLGMIHDGNTARDTRAEAS